MIEKYIVKEETVRRIENIYADRRNFKSSNCAIDALLLIDDNTYCDRCRGCSNFAQVKDEICACMVELGLYELRVI